MRIALLTPILAPYRVAAFRALSDTPGWQLRILVSAESEFDRSWQVDSGGLDVETLATLSLPRADRTLHLTSPWAVWRALARFRPDAVLSSELGTRSLGACLYCRAHGIPWLAWLERTRHRNASAGLARRLFGPALLRCADAAIVPGREGEHALREWGVAAKRIFIAPNCHDAPVFEKRLAAIEPNAAHLALRPALGARARIALVVGRLFPVKGIEPLLDAWELLAPELRDDWTLLLVGDGPLAETLDAASQRRRPGEIVRVPAVQPAEVVDFYAAADLLVFPSLGDVWGIAVNEAMACGLPVVCSPLAGAAADLLIPGETGWLGDPREPQALAKSLREALTCGTRRKLGERARAQVARHRPEDLAEGFRAALRAAVLKAGATL